MKSHMPITEQTLCKIGISKPGHQARLLAHLTDVTLGNRTAMDKVRKSQSKLDGKKKTNMFECCSLPAPAPAFYNFPQLKEWLESISLSSLYNSFVASGYDDYEEIMYLMQSNYPVTD
jgi:hypothetical protein